MHAQLIDTSILNNEDDNQPSAAQLNEIAKRGQGHENLEDSNRETEEPLVDAKNLLTSDRKTEDNNLLRFCSALAIAASLAVAVIFIFSLYGKVSGGDSVSKIESKPSTKEELEETAEPEDKYKAELAITEQKGDLQPTLQLSEEPDKIEKSPAAQPKPQPKPIAERQTPSESEPEELNPLDEWARLAAVGSAIGDSDVAIAFLNERNTPLASSNTRQTSVGSLSRATPEENDPRTQAEPVRDKSTATENTYVSDSLPRTEDTITSDSSNQDELNNSISKGEVAKVASVSIGNIDDSSSRESDLLTEFNSQNPDVIKLLSDEKPNDDYLTRKRKQFQEEDRLAQLSASGVSSAVSSSTAPVAQNKQIKSIPQAQNVSYIAQNPVESKVKQIPLGTTSIGEISNSIIWSEGVASDKSRGIINLSEPLLADDGSVALAANSSLIVEVESIASNGLTSLNAIAISYQDAQGNLKQEVLPPGAILIGGNDHQPLIAEQTSDSGGTVFGQDVLIGLLGAGERGFEVLNEPNDSTTISDDLVVRTSSNRDTSLLNGAAEGVFGTTKERLEDRSEQIVDEEVDRVPIYHLEAGETVSIFVNSFLEIHK